MFLPKPGKPPLNLISSLLKVAEKINLQDARPPNNHIRAIHVYTLIMYTENVPNYTWSKFDNTTNQ